MGNKLGKDNYVVVTGCYNWGGGGTSSGRTQSQVFDHSQVPSYLRLNIMAEKSVTSGPGVGQKGQVKETFPP